MLALLMSGSAMSVADAAQIFLTSGSSWTVPSDWNSASNTIEVIGGGGGGAGSNASTEGAGGGGGGGYSKIMNLTLQPGATISYQIGAGGAGGGATAVGAGGGDTYFNGSGTICQSQSVCAKGGGAGQNSSGLNAAAGGAGGASASGIGAVRYAGGAGGNSGASSNGGGGGGGAAGPWGNGGNGGTSGQNGSGAGGGGNGGGTSGASGGAGGNNSSGVGGGSGGSVGIAGGNGRDGGGGGAGYWNGSAWVNNSGGSGSTGTEWDATHGSGGGGGSGAGGGGGAGAANGSAGFYGGGGSGGSGNSTAGTAGAVGIIVINYTPVPPPASPGTRIYLTSGSTWTVPGDWNNASNTVEVIGAGGGGAGSNSSTEGAGGGGGGGYSKVVNVSLQAGASVTYRIGAGGAGGSAANVGTSGGDTYFNGTGTTCSSQSVCAKGGAYGQNSSGLSAAGGGAGGAAASGIGTIRYSGGAGGGSGANSNGGGGGGGAAGPNGNGGNGGTSGQNGSGAGGGGHGGGSNGAGAGAGGNNYVGTGGGSGGTLRVPGGVGSNGGGGGAGYWDGSAWVNNAGGIGSTGSEWDATHGSGGGGGSGAGGGGGAGAPNGAAGLYGAGGPGGSGNSTAGTAGAQGLIVITYVPATNAGQPPAADTSTITRSSSFAYDAATGLLIQEVIEPDTPALRLQTDYVYDAFGNRRSVTVSGIDITTRASSSVRDAKGQFIGSNTNAIGQSESFQYDGRFGQPLSHTGPNGLTTTWSYDGFGRKTQEITPDGTRTVWSYQYCNGVAGGVASCPQGAAYVVQELHYGADGTTPNGPATAIFVDSLQREIARRTQGFDGRLVQATKAYDALGRVAQASRPYFIDGGAPQYATFAYDALGRLLTETKSDGSVSRTAYHGLSISATNALNQTRTVIKNSQGKVVSITDALNSVMTFSYDAIGNLVRTTDAAGNVVTATYDLRGRKIASTDPDLGSWTYSYNVLGLLVSQTDAKAQTVSLAYDRLDRLVQRVEPDVTSVWVYDMAANGIGKLASSSITAGAGNGFSRRYSYDGLARSTEVATTIDGATYVMGAAYDANGRLTSVSYPSGFTARYGYNQLGYANQLQDAASGQIHWAAAMMDAEGHLTQQSAGNGLVTTQGFDITTGRLVSIATGANGSVQNLGFTYDSLGRLLSRSDANTNVSETFTFDAINRLTSSTVNVSPGPLVKTYAYDPIGNLTSKSDVGTYLYPAAGAPRPHAVTSVSGGSISATFTYDANGNQTSGLGRSIVYTSYNKPASISQGTRTISFVDDTDHQRIKQVTPEGTTLYIAAFGVLAEVSNPGATSQKWTDYLSVGSAKIGMRVVQAGSETLTTRYFHADHLGSISVLTNENGAVTERLSYDSWGRRRNVNGTDDATGSITSASTRGFTGEEQLSIGSLVHLNGRVYDPLLARFTSADPEVSRPSHSQAWNRYSYVYNNPLGYRDSSGFSPLPTFEVLDVIDVIGGIDPWGAQFGALSFGWFNSSVLYGYSGYGYAGGSAYQGAQSLYPGSMARSSTGDSSRSQYSVSTLPGVVAGDEWTPAGGKTTAGARPGGAGEAESTSSYSYAANELPEVNVDAPSHRSRSGRSAVGQAVVNALVPGAYYADLAQTQYHAGNYGFAAIYTTVSLADAALGVLTLGYSARIQASFRSAQVVVPAERETVRLVNPRDLISRQGPREMTGNRVKRLTSNMKKEGFDPNYPVLAAEVEDRLIIVDGHHRTEAAIRAGMKEVPVRVSPVDAEQAAELAADAAEAAGQRGLSWR
ncbi:MULTISPECIES: RHS repeat-associated core domain-containing protein [unclassified Bradyrhizobium]|uniref:RHS repeat-associated core and ParB-like nuclease domain-containing protein n=1 Tax=unclassified Bradyrhizobium TaxID=2631580 RepID=UPI0028EC0318|nr:MULTISPECIES: RHS repeat-associated core domain-containing protein [unclassified Bradyrhizobium]